MGLFDFFKKTAAAIPEVFTTSIYEAIVAKAYDDYKDTNVNYWDFKPNTSTAFSEGLLQLSDQEKVAFILEAIKQCHSFSVSTGGWWSNGKKWVMYSIWNAYMTHLLRLKLDLSDEDIDQILYSFSIHQSSDSASNTILKWPLLSTIVQIERKCKETSPSPALLATLEKLKRNIQRATNTYNERDVVKLIERADKIIYNATTDDDSVKPTLFLGNDAFAPFANEDIKQMPADKQQLWFTLMLHSQRGTGSSPSAKFLKETREVVKAVGDEAFKQQMERWFTHIIGLKETINPRRPYDLPIPILAGPNLDMVKGFVWMCTPFYNKTTLLQIALLAERCYRKVPNVGQAATGVGNACVYVLAHVKGMDGIGHLSRLRLRVKQTSTQALIEKYLNKAAADQGISLHEIEDLAVNDYDLVNGERTWDFEGYMATLRIAGPTKITLSWYKPDGAEQKAVPSFVKDKYATKLKQVKEIVKQVELSVSAQRDRIDRMLKVERSFTWQQFNSLYLYHGLMGSLARKLIWTFEHEGIIATAIYQNNTWVNPTGELPFEPNDSTVIKLWHPAFASITAIQDWRLWLIDQQITQPIKQAFREVYLLTDAELNTRTYSNRMAAHILKQHQFNSLAKLRGWRYTLLGAFDNGAEGLASLQLPDAGLRAEYWVNEVNAENAMADSGIWQYISTDQVRFANAATNEVVPLIDVPRLVLSEVMRDVDLFVGVASVGNDPAWSDNGGLPAFRDYWQGYSFGELTEVAKTRKTILERLVPRLKIASVCSIQDKFLVVKGKLRTYKIHIGSTNILMEPNDQYLCIVPDRSGKGTPGSDSLFIPFEGDNGISVIISKALLLAADDKITDTSITRQIK